MEFSCSALEIVVTVRVFQFDTMDDYQQVVMFFHFKLLVDYGLNCKSTCVAT